MTTEAMRKVIGPPAPLLNQITFLKVNEDEGEESTPETVDEGGPSLADTH
jgi:hypothetical protein